MPFFRGRLRKQNGITLSLREGKEGGREGRREEGGGRREDGGREDGGGNSDDGEGGKGMREEGGGRTVDGAVRREEGGGRRREEGGRGAKLCSRVYGKHILAKSCALAYTGSTFWPKVRNIVRFWGWAGGGNNGRTDGQLKASEFQGFWTETLEN